MIKSLITLLALNYCFGSPLNAMNTSNQIARIEDASWQGMPAEMIQSIFEFLTDKELVNKLATLNKNDLSQINAYFARIYPDSFFNQQQNLFYPVLDLGIYWQQAIYDTTPLTSLCKVKKLNTIPEPTHPAMNRSYLNAGRQCLFALCELYSNNTLLQSLRSAIAANELFFENNFIKLAEDTSLTSAAKISLRLEQNALLQASDNLEENIILELFKTANKDHCSFFIYYLNLVTDRTFIGGRLVEHTIKSLCYIIKALPSSSNTYLRTTLFKQLHQWMNTNSETLLDLNSHLSTLHLELLTLYNKPCFQDLINPEAYEELVNTCANLAMNNDYIDYRSNPIEGIKILTQFIKQGVMSGRIQYFIRNSQEAHFRQERFGQDLALDHVFLVAIEELTTAADQLNSVPTEVTEEVVTEVAN